MARPSIKKGLIPESAHGQRLDRAIGFLAPDLSLRGRRRLIEDGRILVDGRPGKPAQKVRSGQEILFLESRDPAAPTAPAGLVVRNNAFAALAKPAGMHTEMLSGRDNVSLEDSVSDLLGDGWLLVNRLDQATSGLVVAAFGRENSDLYRRWESGGVVVKEYLALASGRIGAELTAEAGLDTKGGPKVRVSAEADPDPLRHTQVRPLRYFEGAGASLVSAVIRRGARHQIRAHLAALGHPLLGDEVYGGPAGARLYLHARAVKCPGLEAELEPDWELPEG